MQSHFSIGSKIHSGIMFRKKRKTSRLFLSLFVQLLIELGHDWMLIDVRYLNRNWRPRGGRDILHLKTNKTTDHMVVHQSFA